VSLTGLSIITASAFQDIKTAYESLVGRFTYVDDRLHPGDGDREVKTYIRLPSYHYRIRLSGLRGSFTIYVQHHEEAAESPSQLHAPGLPLNFPIQK